MEAAKQVDLSMFLDDTNFKKEEPLYLFETDKILEEEYARMKAAANGHKSQT